MQRVMAYVDGFNLYFGLKDSSATTGSMWAHWLKTSLSRASSCGPRITLRPAFRPTAATRPTRSGRTITSKPWPCKGCVASSATTCKRRGSVGNVAQAGPTTKKR
jgi:hypothetical protein